MRTRFGWLIVIAVISLYFTGCNGDGTDAWSDAFVQNFYIGNIPVKAGETVNVPLSSTYNMRFELDRAVTQASLTQLLDFEIWITNMDSDASFLITPDIMDENGTLVWVDDSNKVLEYRLSHDMGRILSGGQSYSLGSSGQRLQVHLMFLIGGTEDGSQFALMEDTFYVIWTDSHSS